MKENNLKNIILFLLFLLLFTACTDDVDLDDLNIKSKMVLYCRVSPDFDTTIAYLSTSQPLLSSNKNTLTTIKNATIEISKDKVTWHKFTYHTAKEKYILLKKDFPIKEGETYYIKATSPNFPDIIKSSCTVPYYRDIQLKIERQIENDEMYSYTKFIYTWKDYPDEKNYYIITAYTTYDYDSYRSMSYSNIYDDSTYNYYYSDLGKDGSILKGTFNYYDTIDTILFIVTQIDEPNYLYEKTINENYYLDFMGFIEPTLMYNNIENGYGLFAGFTFKKYRYIVDNKKLEEF